MAKSKRKPARRPAPRPARRPHAPRPAAAAPATGGARRVLEVRSVGLLSTLHRMPRWLVPLLLAVFLVLGLVLPTRWAGLLLVLIAGFLGWLLALSWPLLDGRGRAVRALVVLALAVVAVLRLLGSF